MPSTSWDTWSTRTSPSGWFALGSILESGEAEPFSPGDPKAHTMFDGWTIDALLGRFAAVRQESLRTLRGWNLTEAQLRLQGRHTIFGIVTLGELLATWTVHDLTHITQVARVMAKRYSGDVGAWKDYLSILD